jgi:hypothetical protein
VKQAGLEHAAQLLPVYVPRPRSRSAPPTSINRSSAFAGSSIVAPQGRALTQMNGYRLDWMLEKKDGSSDLQTQDGYWVGEVGFERSQGAQGLRYRMRPTRQEYLNETEVAGLMYQIGPFKVKAGECFGGVATNEALRKLKRQIVKEGITDPAKIEENKYWKQRYGYERWDVDAVDQACGQDGNDRGWWPSLGQWSGVDPLQEDRNRVWFEADWGKPYLGKYMGTKLPGFVSAAQVEREYDTGKLNGRYLSMPREGNDNRVTSGVEGAAPFLSLPAGR